MRRILSTLLTSVLATNLFLPTIHAESSITEMSEIKVTVNGTQVNFDVPPAMKDDRTLVPVRTIFEAMGASVFWDEKSKTITAIKNEGFVNLVINSDIAQIEGEDFQLDVPAMIYKDRTLVPLRFISEAFDGEVIWDAETKQITITVPPTVFIPVDSPIYLNNKQLDFGSFTPVVWNGITFIPIEPVLNNISISNEFNWKRNGNEVTIQVDDTEITFYVNKNYATIDGEQMELSNPLFEYEGTLVVPIGTITKVFSGYSHYVAETKEIYIYTNQTRFKHEFLTKEPITFITPTNVATATVIGNRRLMVSDNPENLNERTVPEENVTLWHDALHIGEESKDHRVFGWHVNEFDQDISIGITVENLSSTNEIEVVDIKGLNRKILVGSVNYDLGLPIAENMLSGNLPNTKMDKPIVKGHEIAVIKSFDVGEKQTIGFQYDFTVKKKAGTGNLKYKVRTVLSKNGQELTSIVSDPVEIDQTALHPRGVWSSSQLETELPPYEVGNEEIAYQISNGVTDNVLSVQTGLGDQTKMVKNHGHFGASYIVKIPVINKTGDSKTVRVRVGARGGIYNGAVKVDEKVSLIPTLNPMKEVANVVDYVVEKESGLIELEIMHAGGSALPLAIDIITVE